MEGLLGGWGTLQAATSAYISDCTSDGSRAHIFSRFTGVFYLGFAVGPAIGAFLIRHPFIPIFSPAIGVHNGAPTVTSVFYVAATASFINLLLALFLFPESLEKKKAKATMVQPSTSVTAQSGSDAPRQSAVAHFLSPLTLFLPKTIDVPDGRKRTDWSMTLLALVLFGHLLSLVSPEYGCQSSTYSVVCRVCSKSSTCMPSIYMVGVLNRSAMVQIRLRYLLTGCIQLSYYISAMGFSRALHLLFVLPCKQQIRRVAPGASC